MDDEDLREAEELRALQTSETFAGFGDARDPRHEGTLIDIFRPSGETVGAKLLKRMGWKEGQGIGPRIKRAANLGEGQYSESQTHTFAPRDVPILALSQKLDRKGLGFDGVESSVTTKFESAARTDWSDEREDGGPEALESSLSLLKSRRPARARKGGFGVGVLNDTGSDDEDPYSMGPKISYNKTISGDKANRKDKKKSLVNPALRNKPVLLSKKSHGIGNALRKCHDGKLPLDGFVLGDHLDAMSQLSLTRDKHRPPEVPAGWVSSLSSTHEKHGDGNFPSVADAAKASIHDAKTRASLLGEAALPGKSVFDYLSPATRDRLAAVTGNTNLPPGLGEAPTQAGAVKSGEAALADLVPYLDPSAALQALNRSSESSANWLPYAEDLDKRERYLTFLRLKAGLNADQGVDGLPSRLGGMSNADWVNEMNEFARAAEVFKPISGLMASRFTSSSSGNPGSETGESGSLLTYKQNKPEDPAESAAKMGMFGHLTRSVTTFYPTRLLCKRFGIAMPDISDTHNAGDTSAKPSAQQEFVSNVTKFTSAGYQSNEKSEPTVRSMPVGTTSADTLEIDPVREEAAESQRIVTADRNEVLEQEKPGMALFKSIFGSEDEDEDD
jgi:G patch domain-containing protein 1